MITTQEIFIRDKRVGVSYYDDKLPTALRTTQADAQKEGLVVASMPELLVLRRQLPFTDSMWSTWYTCNSEEDVGTTPEGNKVVIAVHGGGILTPDRIETAYKRGLTKQYAAHLAESEVRKLLEGKLADGIQIPVYQFSDLKSGIKDKPRQYAVVMDFAEAQKAVSGHLPVESLRDNPLVIVRAGGVAEANAFVDKVAQRYTNYGNWHPFNAINADETQGRVLFVSVDLIGLLGSLSLYGNGRFAGVAPEALDAARVDAKKLEDMVTVRLPRNILDAMKSGTDFTYEGRAYSLKPQQ